MRERLHVALLTPGFPADEEDSGCIPALQDYVLGLRRARPDWRISVFALHYPACRAPYLWQGVEVIPIGGGNRRWPFSPLARARLLASLFRAGPFDLLHAFWLGDCAGLGHLVARLTRRPLIVTLMGQEVRRVDRWRRLMGRPGVTTVAVSPFQRQILLRTGGPDADHTIPWGVEAAALVSTARDIDLLAVGNLIPVKDPLGFVRVVAKVAARRPGLRACWAGGGPMQAAAAALAADLGITDNLHFTGAVPREAVFDLMERSRVLLHMAEFESFAMVLAEARAHGMQVVSRPVGIAPASPGPGFHLADGEPAMVEAVLAALSSPPVAPTRPWPLEATVDAYLDLYRGLVA